MISFCSSNNETFSEEQKSDIMIVDIYLITISFFTGLLSVATSAQLYRSHLVARAIDSTLAIKKYKYINRLFWYLLQTVTTLIIATLVFMAPFNGLTQVLLGEERNWTDVELSIAQACWTIMNILVLLDTILLSILSLYLLAMKKEKGGALAILMAAAGAYDFLNVKRILGVLGVCFDIDKVKVWHQVKAIKAVDDFTVVPTSIRVNCELEAYYKANDAVSKIRTALTSIGVTEYGNIYLSAFFCYTLRWMYKETYFKQLNQKQITSQLSVESIAMYTAMLHVGREEYWRFTQEKVDYNGNLLDPRMIALDNLLTFRRVTKWKLGDITVINSLLHWVRSRNVAEFIIQTQYNLNFKVILRNSRETQEIDATWWKYVPKTLTISERVKKTFNQVQITKNIRVEHMKWREWCGFNYGNNYYQPEWLQDRKNNLDNLGHGRDWSQTTVVFDKNSSGLEIHVQNLGNVPPSETRILQEIEWFNIRGSGENIKGMDAGGWFILSLLDKAELVKQLISCSSGDFQKTWFLKYALGRELLGAIRVILRRAGHSKIVIKTNCNIFSNHQLANQFNSADIEMSAILQMGEIALGWNIEMSQEQQQWYQKELPFIIVQ